MSFIPSNLGKGRFSTLLLAGGLITLVFACEARSQQPSSADQMRTLLEHRQDLSARSVQETTKQRFEDKKSDTTFPSDRVKNTVDVVRALTPEQQKALQHNERGLQLFSKGKLEGAIKEYQEAIRLDPKLAAAQNNLGSAQFAAARFDEAATSFRLASELDADSGQALFNLALAQIKLGLQKEATVSLDSAMRSYLVSGDKHLRDGRLSKAEEAFRGMLQIDAEYAPALLRLGLVCNESGRYEEAAQSAHRVTEREPNNAVAHVLLAEAFNGQHKYDQAAISAETAIKLSPDFPHAIYAAGVARAELRQRDEALAHLTRLRQLKAVNLADQLSDLIEKKAPPK